MIATTIIIYPLICCALFYLGAQATITGFLWGRYPPRLDAFMSCPACTGFWYGAACAGLGWWQDWPFLGLDGQHWLTPIIVGVCSIIWTPILSAKHTQAMTGGYSAESQVADNVVPLRQHETPQ